MNSFEFSDSIAGQGGSPQLGAKPKPGQAQAKLKLKPKSKPA